MSQDSSYHGNNKSRLISRRGVLKTMGAAGVVSSLAGISSGSVASPEQNEHINVQRWSRAQKFAAGQFQGTRPTNRAKSLTIAHPIGEREYVDPFGHGTKTWEYSRWISPTHSMGFGAKELIASWTVDAPPSTWLEVEMRGTTTNDDHTDWYVMGRWAATDEDIHRTSVPDQDDEYGGIAIDTFKAADGVTLRSYQVRATLYRLPESDHSPVLHSVSAMTSNLPQQKHVDASPLGGAEGIVLDVPQYSQVIHKGEYPKWDGGGAAWCSPTSTAMVLSYWGRGPTEEQMSWVNPAYKDPQVDFAARGTYDYSYDGCGNWPFNIAYAGRFGLDGFVTRLHSLTELEQYIKDGIPVITSESFTENELPGAGYGTPGHLMVIVGFTEDGNVVGNDPFAPTNEDVRRVYPRAAFENVWQRTTGTGGIAYIIYPPGHTHPEPPSEHEEWVARLQPSTTEATVGERITFSIKDTSKNGRWIRSLDWRFGDGTSGTGWWNAHRYDKAGTYIAALTATDNTGHSTTDEVTVTVGEFEEAIARVQPSMTETTVGERITFQVEDTSGDDRWIESLEWTFGDGTSGTGWWNAHRYDEAGTYTVTLTATDNTSHSTTDTVAIVVS